MLHEAPPKTMTAHFNKMFVNVLDLRGADRTRRGRGPCTCRDASRDTGVIAWSARRESLIHNASMELNTAVMNHAVMPFQLLTGKLKAHSKMLREVAPGSLECKVDEFILSPNKC